MKYLLRQGFLVVLIGLIVCAGSATVQPQEIPNNLPDAVVATRSALVRIHVVSTDYEQGREVKEESFGSGVIISEDGYVLTNHHVVSEAEHVSCTLTDRRIIEAKLVGTDPLSDIAVIKLPSEDGNKYPYASFGDSSALKVGQTVYAMGSPLSISQSVTQGIVSITEMVMPEMFGSDALKLEGEDVGSVVLWIGHDAQIESGNSGGPLVDSSGKIVGINEISLGLSGAIPSNLASSIAEQLISKGEVARSWFGVKLQPLLRSGGASEGVLVANVGADTTGAQAGIVPGDILLSINETPVIARFREQIPAVNQLIYSLPVDENVKLRVLRDGTEQTIELKTSLRPGFAKKQHEVKSWGICATNLDYHIQREMQLESQDGVLITSILPSGPAGAAKPSLRETDIVTSLDGKPIKNLDDLRTLTNIIITDKEKAVPVIVEFLRKSDRYATVVKLGKTDETESGREIAKAWLPVETQPLTKELARALGIPRQTGVRITRVHPDSVASKAELKVGDIIVKLDGEEIPAEDMNDNEVFPSMVRQYEIGTEVTLGLLRNKKPVQVKVELPAAPKPVSDYEKYLNEYFDFEVRDIAFIDRSKGSVSKESAGVFVNSVTSGGWASLAKLQATDVITQINGVETKGVEDFKAAMTQVEQDKPDFVVFRVQRGIYTMFLEVKPEWPE